MQLPTLALALITYLVPAVYVAKLFFAGTTPNRTQRFAVLGTVLCALLLHGFAMANAFGAAVLDGSAQLSMVNVVSLLAWTMVVVLTLSHVFITQWSLLSVTLGFAGLTCLLAIVAPESYILDQDTQAPMVTHVVLSLTGYGCVVVALLYALQMRYIHQQLKTKQLNPTVLTLPPLLQVEHWVLRLIYIGSILLTFALISGFLTLDTMFAKEYAHKTVLSASALLLFVAMLFWQKRWGLTPKTILVITSVGVAILTLGYFGSRFVQDILLT